MSNGVYLTREEIGVLMTMVAQLDPERYRSATAKSIIYRFKSAREVDSKITLFIEGMNT